MQSISGLHVGSLIDRKMFDVRLYHEDWHGPFDPAACAGYDLVFLSGLQVDFDRMRQLAYYFRRSGATVVAGGSVCTSFPEFATRFFDAVCAGGVDSVPAVVEDFLRGTLKPIYRSNIVAVSSYRVDYSLFARSRISPIVHLIEASRGCSFKCSFCVIPPEAGGHAPYELNGLAQAVDNAIAASPRFSFRRWYPMFLFLDNNFSDDHEHMLSVCDMMRRNPKVKGWAALLTQNILHDRELIRHLADSKCVGLFAGLESLDADMLRRYNKKQNLSRRFSVIDDIAYAESQGICITYGYLFDPRHQTAAQMEQQIRGIAESRLMPMPVYMSVVAPLAGTETFWEDLDARNLAPNLRLRDLDGETIAYARLADTEQALVGFIERMFRRPWTVISPGGIILKTLRRVTRCGSLDPIRWFMIASANLHCYLWSQATPARPRSYMAGTDTLDPQYFERPADLTEADRLRYFEPVSLTDDAGGPAEWLIPYVPRARKAKQPPPEMERAPA
jgi:radical SAM superfamily enzyme YgiQ (UPF0313 family)